MKKTGKTVRRRLIKPGWLLLGMAALDPGLGWAEEPKESPFVTALKSLSLSGYAQIYAAAWAKDTDTFSLRRARVALSGQLVKHLKFRINIDAIKSPILIDAEVEFEPSRLVGLKFGQFRLPFSFESFYSTADLDMVNRTSVVDTLAPGRDNGSSGRDIGIALYGSYAILDYMFGLFNGAGINKTDTNSHKDWSGRVVIRPVKFLAVGGSLYRGKQSPSADVPLVRRDKEGLEAVLAIKRFSLRSEYLHALDDTMNKAGWYAQAGFFALPGKLQALVRYDFLDLDRAVPDDAKNVITLGFNWFIQGRTKLQVNYEIHRLETGGSEESGLLVQFQAGF